TCYTSEDEHYAGACVAHHKQIGFAGFLKDRALPMPARVENGAQAVRPTRRYGCSASIPPHGVSPNQELRAFSRAETCTSKAGEDYETLSRLNSYATRLLEGSHPSWM